MNLEPLRMWIDTALRVVEVLMPRHELLGPALCSCGRAADGILKGCCRYPICHECVENNVRSDATGLVFRCPHCSKEKRAE